jgi:hypothetical protein
LPDEGEILVLQPEGDWFKVIARIPALAP